MASSLPLLLLVLCCLSLSMAQLTVYNIRGQNIRPNVGEIPDSYVKVFYRRDRIGMTTTRMNTNHPSWSERFVYNDAKKTAALRVIIYNEDSIYHAEMGRCETAIKPGTYNIHCSIPYGGTLFFTYTLK